MSKNTKRWLIAAASLVTIGAIMFAAVMTAYHWDFSGLSTVECKTNTYEMSEQFRGITIHSDTSDIFFAASNDGICRVVCYEPENVKHSVAVQDGVLSVNTSDNREWFEYIGINLCSPKITVYLPNTEYKSLVIKESTGNVEIPKTFSFDDAEISLSTGEVNCSASVRRKAEIKTSTGDISVNNATIGNLDITVSTGDVTVSDVVCENVLSSGSTGNVSLKNVTAGKKISIERSTGDVRFDNSDASDIFVKTSTGDVTGSLLTEKVFVTETSTGSIKVPKTTTGGTCKIITTTGDIIF